LRAVLVPIFTMFSPPKCDWMFSRHPGASRK
jgi:hypothetical protein